MEAPTVSAAADDLVPTAWFAVRHLWRHAGVLGLLLLALIPLFDTYSPAIADEGLYATQVDQLSNGSWSAARPALDVDPDGRYQVMVEALVDEDGAIPYARRPAYPLLLVPAYWLLGSAGILVMSVVGAWLAAVGSALLARRIDPRFAVPTLWLVGIGSPLLFDAYVVVGHSIAAGLAVFVVYGATRIADDHATQWMAPTLVAVALLVLVRSEGTILVAAAAIVVATSSLRVRPSRSVDHWRLGTGVALGVTGAVAFLVDGRLAGWASAGLQGSTGSVVSTTDPMTAVWTDLLRPWYSDGSATASSVIVVLSLVLAAVALRVLPRRSLLPMALCCVAALVAVARHVEPVDLISGLVPAWPVLTAVILLGRDQLRHVGVARPLAISAVTVLALLWTVYGVYDAPQWGGRFFHVLIPLLAPAVVAGLWRGASQLEARHAAVCGIAVVITTLALSTLALRANMDRRSVLSELVRESVVFAESTSADGDPLIVVAGSVPSGTARHWWRPAVDGVDVLSNPQFPYLFELLFAADRAGRRDLVIVSDLGADTVAMTIGAPLGDLGWRISEVEDLPGNYSAVRVEDATV